MAGSGSTCTPATLTGNFIKDSTLDGRHSISVDVDVTVPGSYSITTNTLNGYFFSATGTFGATGTQTITLNGSGKPVAAGTNSFTVTGGGTTCTFSVTVTATAPAGCNPNVQGTYTVGTATGTTNTVTLTHTYAAANTYNITTTMSPANGYSFGPLSYNATAGSNTITLNATGTPTTAGTKTFTVNFGDGTNCTFTVTVAAGTVTNVDYFPTTQGSYWTYSDSIPSDTFRVAVNGITPFGTNTFQNFVYSGYYTGNEYYRKETASGFYYQTTDTAGWGPEVVFNVPRLEVNFLKNTLSTGADWRSDFTATIFGQPGTLRFFFFCESGNSTVTVNGRTFTDVYKVRQQLQYNIGAGFLNAGPPLYAYYAKGVGLILVEDINNARIQSIRYWVVN